MMRCPEQRPRIAVLLGKPVRDGTVLAAVLEHLRAGPAAVTVHLPKGDAPLPDWLFGAEMVVQRGLGVPELTSALRLEHAGVRCCNRIAATIAVRDRALTVQKLAAAGAPVPATVLAGTWPELVDLAASQPVVVKAADGRAGRGIGVLIAATGRLPPEAPFPGPYIVQEYVRGDERVHKVYVVGRRANGLIKYWPPRLTAGERSAPFTVDGELGDLSRLVGTAIGMEIYGVDVLYGPKGPVVVDVNPFPSFAGVPRAAPLIARHVMAIATGHGEL